MLSRRHIRLKVMQSLYAYFSSCENNAGASEKNMFKHISQVVDLKLVIIALLLELVKHADNFYDESKKKYFPTASDLQPNRKFIDNAIIVSIKENNKLIEKLNSVLKIWVNNDHDIVRKLFMQIYKSDLYNNYLLIADKSYQKESKFIVDIMNKFILNNELVHHILEEQSIYWIDDLPFVATIIFGEFKNGDSLYPGKVFKDKSDKNFALKLFRNTIKNNLYYQDLIVRFSKNWDLERIAIMDQLLLKMAFTEILTMEELPVKVSINEYIEISKYYSTSKSKLFVNGLLDNFVKTLTNEGKIIKSGKGLL